MPRLLVAAAFAVACAYAHSIGPGVQCNASTPEAYPITSYHVHVQFLENNKASVARAQQLHTDFIKWYWAGVTPVLCTADFHQKEMCIWANDPCMGPIGPFEGGQFAVYVPIEQFQKTVGWFMQFRNGLTVFVHPNTGCNKVDHSTWPMWMGEPYPLDIDQFDGQEPTPIHECPDPSVSRAYWPCCGKWNPV